MSKISELFDIVTGRHEARMADMDAFLYDLRAVYHGTIPDPYGKAAPPTAADIEAGEYAALAAEAAARATIVEHQGSRYVVQDGHLVPLGKAVI